MNQLIAGMLLFFGAHLIPNIGATRANMINRFGEKGYTLAYVGLSVAGIVLMSMGKNGAEYVDVWSTPAWGRYATLLLMALSAVWFVAMFLPTNLKRRFHHPMLAFVGFWGLAHLCSNGDLASMLLFGSLFIFSVFKILSLNQRKPADENPPVPVTRDLLVLVLAAVLYAGLLFAHPYIAGVPII